MEQTKKTDRKGYNEHYRDNLSDLVHIGSVNDYIDAYERTKIGPFYQSGLTKGYVRGGAIRRLLETIEARGQDRRELTVLDAGFGQGELSVYLACLGFRVIGIDISSSAKECAEILARSVDVGNRCSFRTESLERTSIDEASIDYVIGHASLHHFIKYDGVPAEFYRVMKNDAKGFFADSYGENRIYHLFHDKEKMQRLGDVTLTKSLIESYFEGFSPRITPVDWFVMLDKLYLKILPGSAKDTIRKISRIHFWLDRKISVNSRFTLMLSGSVVTEITRQSHACIQ